MQYEQVTKDKRIEFSLLPEIYLRNGQLLNKLLSNNYSLISGNGIGFFQTDLYQYGLSSQIKTTIPTTLITDQWTLSVYVRITEIDISSNILDISNTNGDTLLSFRVIPHQKK